ncbi:Squalestatin S1 biosynthesis cluster protein [Podosphaera aphanis]|nr:Squalestatin S1 biosynthesis cluster protein [Podosphaera aphanis]
MKLVLLPNHSINFSLLAQLSLVFLSVVPVANAFVFRKAPAVNLNLGDLGRTAFAGDFDGISIYEFEGQSQNGFNKNGSQSLLGRLPNGEFTNLVSSDAGIHAICTFNAKDRNTTEVVVGGNFTDLGGVESPGIALFNPNTSTVAPLTGISGQVSALLCDQTSNTIYVGGSFKSANSTNAAMWTKTDGWKSLPFGGFNGPVNSITKAPNGNVVFGGSFTGLGNVTDQSEPDDININLSDAAISAGSTTSTPGFNDPTKIICKNSVEDSWLLAENTPGFWRADFGFTFQPTRLRLWNTHVEGRGTKTFRYTALPINGIMNLTYIDPGTKQLQSCSSECPLSSNPNVPFQDFHFVNVIGMNAFQIDISDWYGSGGGLAGIELVQNDIFSYAINEFNEHTCARTTTAATVKLAGPWSISPSLQSFSKYLTTSGAGDSTESASIVFLPDIRKSGNYSVNVYTPGCIQDNSCESRGRVNITGFMSKKTDNSADFSIDIFQTNNYDKYDQIYFGYIEAGSSSFRPSVTMQRSDGQDAQIFTFVAQRMGFTLISSNAGLNGLFEYDASKNQTTSDDFEKSSFDAAGTKLPMGSEIKVIQTLGDTTFIGGNFSGDGLNNIFKITNGTFQPLSDGGLNAEVEAMFIDGKTLYTGGAFSSTNSPGIPGLDNIAAYDTSDNVWSALGAGVDGPVHKIVPVIVNITNNEPVDTIALTGTFTQVLGFSKNPPFSAAGFAIWVPSRNNWLRNLNPPTMLIEGSLTAATTIPGETYLYAGSISSSQLSTTDVVEVNTAGTVFKPLPELIQSSSLQAPLVGHESTSDRNPSGVVTGLFYVNGYRNITILGGHFSTTGSNGSEVNNLSFIDGSDGDTVSGVGPSISPDSTILAMAFQDDTLYAGGSLNGNVNGVSVKGLISYNLVSLSFDTQPPSLDGDVHSIVIRRSTRDVYVGGNFSSAGSLSCPAVCQFSTTVSQWNRPGSGLEGAANSLVWASSSSLIVGGDLKLNGAATPLVTFNTKSLIWNPAAGSEAIPGPVRTIAKANSNTSQMWVSGIAKNGTVFLMKYDGSTWSPISGLLGPQTQINGLQVLPVASNRASSGGLVSAGSVLLVLGNLDLPGFGSVSAALFNGTSFQPYILTTSLDGKSGNLSQFFTEKENTFKSASGKLAKGFVVLISLAFALVIIMLVIVVGLFVERLRKKQEGYSPAPTNSYERGNSLTSRVPPEQLFGSIGQGGRKAVEKQATLI